MYLGQVSILVRFVSGSVCLPMTEAAFYLMVGLAVLFCSSAVVNPRVGHTMDNS